MNTMSVRNIAPVFCLAFVAGIHAQQSSQATRVTSVPRLVRVGGFFHPADGSSPVGLQSVTLSIYREQQGGAALWYETHDVELDQTGNYAVLLGSTKTEGVPLDLFSTGEGLWLGVQFNRPGEAEQ